jgi:hypothetical protein
MSYTIKNDEFYNWELIEKNKGEDLMVRKSIVILLLGLIILSCMAAVSADNITGEDVEIDPEEYESIYLLFVNKDDKLDVKVTSDIEVNVYIFDSDDWSFSPDYSKAKVTKEGITSTSFSYTIPEDDAYYLIIYNPSNTTTATVDYEYTDYLEERVEEATAWFGMAVGICIVVVIVIIVVIVLIIYFAIKYSSRKDQPPPPYPPQGYQPPPPPPPPTR